MSEKKWRYEFTEEAKKDFASDDLDVVKKALEKLQTESQEIVAKLYQNTGANAGDQGANQGAEGDNINVNPDDIHVGE